VETEMQAAATSGQIGWIPLPGSWPPYLLGGVSTRRGGVSGGPYSSLNLGTNVGDLPDRVARNLRLLSAAARVDLCQAARARLVHGNEVIAVDRPGNVGEADGLITGRRGLPLAITVADCLPLALAAADRAIGLVHCGWRSILAGIVPRAAGALAHLARSAPHDLRAWIGPGIGPCCFSVGAEIAGRFAREAAAAKGHGEGGAFVDLAGRIHHELREAGVQTEKIHNSAICSACHAELFFSHRRDRGRSGRMLAWLVLGDQGTPPEPLSPGP
jgi:YfiH family protein